MAWPGTQNVTTAALTCQVVGFFMVEDRVQRGAAGLAAGAAMDAGWELAVAALKVWLGALVCLSSRCRRARATSASARLCEILLF